MSTANRIDELRQKFNENPRRYFAPLANEYRKAGDLVQAIALCREHLPKQPGHMSGYIVFGQALFEARQFEEAQEVFEQALALDPENLIALRHLGDIALAKNRPSLARRWYERVLDADPRNDDIAAQLVSLAGMSTPRGGLPAIDEQSPPPASVQATFAPPSGTPSPVVELPPVRFTPRNFEPIDLDMPKARSNLTPSYPPRVIDVPPIHTPDAALRAVDEFPVSSPHEVAPNETAQPISDALEAFAAFDPAHALEDELAHAAPPSAAEPEAEDLSWLVGSTPAASTPSPEPAAPREPPAFEEFDFEEGLVAPVWPDTQELVARIQTPVRSATPIATPIASADLDAFGREAHDYLQAHREPSAAEASAPPVAPDVPEEVTAVPATNAVAVTHDAAATHDAADDGLLDLGAAFETPAPAAQESLPDVDFASAFATDAVESPLDDASETHDEVVAAAIDEPMPHHEFGIGLVVAFDEPPVDAAAVPDTIPERSAEIEELPWLSTFGATAASDATLDATLGEPTFAEYGMAAAQTPTGDSESDVELEFGSEVESHVDTHVESYAEWHVESRVEAHAEPEIESHVESVMELDIDTGVRSRFESALEIDTEGAVEVPVAPTFEAALPVDDAVAASGEPPVEAPIDVIFETPAEASFEASVETLLGMSVQTPPRVEAQIPEVEAGPSEPAIADAFADTEPAIADAFADIEPAIADTFAGLPPVSFDEASFADVIDDDLQRAVESSSLPLGDEDNTGEVEVEIRSVYNTPAPYVAAIPTPPEPAPAVPTPALPMAAVPVPAAPTPAIGSAAFVTETMAELLVSQGFVVRAVEVYEELVRRRPYDEVLTSRLAELRDVVAKSDAPVPRPAPTPRAVTPVASSPAVPTPVASPAMSGTPVNMPAYRQTPLSATPVYSTPLSNTPLSSPITAGTPISARAISDADDSPPMRTARDRFAELARRRVPRRTPPRATASIEEPADGLASLFGAEPANAADDAAAQALAAAFSPVTEGGPSLFEPELASGSNRATPIGTPAYPTPPAQRAPRTGSAEFSFDRFFPDPASTSAPGQSVAPSSGSPSSAPEPQTGEDHAQFSAWLKGLTKP